MRVRGRDGVRVGWSEGGRDEGVREGWLIVCSQWRLCWSAVTLWFYIMSPQYNDTGVGTNKG